MKTAKILKIGLALTAGTLLAIALNKNKKDDEYWHAEYFNNETLSGEPAFIEDNILDISNNWHGQPPKPGMRNYLWSARYTKKYYFEKKGTLITISSDYGTRVYIDDELFIDNWISHYTRISQTTELTGLHTVTIEYWSKYDSGNSWINYLIYRQETFETPPDSQSIINNGNFSQGMTSWGIHKTDRNPPITCPQYAYITEIDGTPTLHFNGQPRDGCWVESWNCQFPRVHPGDTIIVTCKVRTGPEGPPPYTHKWAGIGYDLRAVINGVVQSDPISELTPARIVSQDWIEQYWKLTIPPIQLYSYPDQQYYMKGTPEKIEYMHKGAGRGTHITPIDSPMPDEMTLCIWTDIGGYDSLQWAEYQNVKVWIIPKEQP